MGNSTTRAADGTLHASHDEPSAGGAAVAHAAVVAQMEKLTPGVAQLGSCTTCRWEGHPAEDCPAMSSLKKHFKEDEVHHAI